MLAPDRPVREPARDFHRRMWHVRRVGWVAMLLLALAGLSGLLGPGPMSSIEIQGSRGLRIEHQRFGRADAPQAMRIHIPGVPGGQDYRVAIGRELLDRVRIESVDPAPAWAEARPDRVVYVFKGPPDAGGAVATFHFTPRAIGIVRATVGLPDATPVSVPLVVYP